MSGTPECVWHGHWPSPPIWVRIPVSFQYESIRVLVECMDVSQCCIFFLFFLQSASDFSLLFRFMWSSWQTISKCDKLASESPWRFAVFHSPADKEQSGAAGQYWGINASSLLHFNTSPYVFYFFSFACGWHLHGSTMYSWPALPW